MAVCSEQTKGNKKMKMKMNLRVTIILESGYVGSIPHSDGVGSNHGDPQSKGHSWICNPAFDENLNSATGYFIGRVSERTVCDPFFKHATVGYVVTWLRSFTNGSCSVTMQPCLVKWLQLRLRPVTK